MSTIKTKRWHYSGDINLEYGGIFIQDSGYPDHVYAVEVIAGSDLGFADCQFIVNRGSIYIGTDKEDIKRALECSRLYESDKPDWKQIALAMNAYRGMDIEDQNTYQIGKLTNYDPDKAHEFNPDYQLRGNTSLRRFIRTEFLELRR